MQQQTLSFDQLPGAITELHQKMDGVESLILQLLNNKPKTKERLTAPEAAKYLNLALPTLYAYTSQRKIRHFKSGKKLMFYVSDLNEFLQSGKIKTADELANDALLKRRK